MEDIKFDESMINFDSAYINQNKIAVLVLGRVEISAGEVMGTLPLKLRPASTRNFRFFSVGMENIIIEINTGGEVKVIRLTKDLKRTDEKGNRVGNGVEEEEVKGKVMTGHNILEYDLLDRKEIEVVGKLRSGVEISVPGMKNVKNGDVVGVVKGENVNPKGDRGILIVDADGDWMCLIVDSTGTITARNIKKKGARASWNQLFLRYCHE